MNSNTLKFDFSPPEGSGNANGGFQFEPPQPITNATNPKVVFSLRNSSDTFVFGQSDDQV